MLSQLHTSADLLLG